MCCSDKKSGCQCPDELKGNPQDCTPEQIEKCHGPGGDHPCVPKKEEKWPKI